MSEQRATYTVNAPVADKDILQRVISRYTRKGNRGDVLDDPLLYIQTIYMPSGAPYSLKEHDDLVEIAQDTSRIVIVRKAAQKGVTELMLRLQIWLTMRGYNTAYYLRSRAYMRTIVQSRLEPLIAANPPLIEAIVPEDSEGRKIPQKYKMTDNKVLKRMNNAYMLHLGLQTEADVRSYPLDAIFVDEVETLRPEYADAIHERLYHSSLKWERWFSQPTAVGFGIDEKYQITDQRHQVFTCDKCNSEFILEESFPACLAGVNEQGKVVPLTEPKALQASYQSYSYICPRCTAQIVPIQMRWQWVPKYPSRSQDAHGYHLTQIYSYTMDAAEVARLYRIASRSSARMERFVASVLGLPYSGGETQPIDPNRLAYHDGVSIDRDAPRYAGVDVGDTLHLVIIQAAGGGRWDVVTVEQLEGPTMWDDLRAMLTTYGVSAVGINAMPYKDSAKRLIRSLYPHIDGAIIYDTSDDIRYFAGTEDAEYGMPVRRINAPRTEMMDSTVSALLSHTVRLPPRYRQDTQLLVSHLCQYIVVRDAQGNRRYARHRTDHAGRALDYALAVARSDHHLPPEVITHDNLYVPIPIRPVIL